MRLEQNGPEVVILAERTHRALQAQRGGQEQRLLQAGPASASASREADRPAGRPGPSFGPLGQDRGGGFAFFAPLGRRDRLLGDQAQGDQLDDGPVQHRRRARRPSSGGRAGGLEVLLDLRRRLPLLAGGQAAARGPATRSGKSPGGSVMLGPSGTVLFLPHAPERDGRQDRLDRLFGPATTSPASTRTTR